MVACGGRRFNGLFVLTTKTIVCGIVLPFPIKGQVRRRMNSWIDCASRHPRVLVRAESRRFTLPRSDGLLHVARKARDCSARIRAHGLSINFWTCPTGLYQSPNRPLTRDPSSEVLLRLVQKQYSIVNRPLSVASGLR
jgi:hypothetical protein